MDRARALARPWMEKEGAIGAWIVGSATRPHRDAFSDLDIEVAFEDEAYGRLPPEERHVLVEDPRVPGRVDHEFYAWAWSEFASLVSSRQDHFHYPFQHAVVLHDLQGRVAPVVRALAALPPEVREERLRVHFLEWAFGAGRARRTWERGDGLDARLVVGDALRGLVKTLFLAAGSWPATRHWTGPELRLLGVPEEVLAALHAALRTPDDASLRALHERAVPWLRGRGLSFLDDLRAVVRWAFLEREGRSAFERWT